MAPGRDRSDPRESRPGWFGFGKFLLLMLFVVLVYLLGRSMVRHHFFSGGGLNYHLSAGR